ncbi:hypothetical protein BKA93DRAFT_390334 [Sparassis latifolia]
MLHTLCKTRPLINSGSILFAHSALTLHTTNWQTVTSKSRSALSSLGTNDGYYQKVRQHPPGGRSPSNSPITGRSMWCTGTGRPAAVDAR